MFALANTEMRPDLAIPPLEEVTDLLSSSRVDWEQRLLPIFDRHGDLVVPRHYRSLVGALVDLYVVAMRVRDKRKDKEHFYLQVRSMKILQCGGLL